MPRTFFKLAALALTVVATFGSPSAGVAAPRTVTVDIRDMKYAQPTLTVAPGTTVTWVNKDEMPHTVTDRGRGFGSAALDTGESFSYTFTKPGEFTYFCTLHPMMVGKIVVKPPGS